MASGDVGANGDGNKESECMCDRSGDKAGGGGGTVVGEFVEGHARAFAGEDEDESGEELGEASLQGVRVSGLLRPTDGDVPDGHVCVLMVEE